MIETEGIPRLNSTSHEWVKHPTRLIARFPGARLKKQEGRQSPFWTVCGPYPSKRLPAALNWIGFSYSPLRAPFWTVCGPYPSKGFRQPRTGSGFRTHASRLLFGPSAARIPQKGFRQPRTGPLHTSGYLFQAVTAWILQNGLCGSPRDLRLVYRAAGLFSRFKVSRWLHLFAPSRVAAPSGHSRQLYVRASDTLARSTCHLETKSACSASCIFFLLSFSASVPWWAKTFESPCEQAPHMIQRLFSLSR